tara:strand:- start:127 stop:504 length:378 start_codon:yes stop_codon:yes gene_type:complete
MNLINVVAAIIIKDNLYFIAQRNKNKHLGLKWEFPGGKVDINESNEEALLREIKEELNIIIQIEKKIAKKKYNDKKINIVLHYYICHIKNGIIRLNEHENSKWLTKKNLSKYDFVTGDRDILSLL